MLFANEGDTAPDGMVTVGRFEDPVEAQMARGMLESARVECFLVGENVNNLLPSAFRVRVQVRAQDEAAVRELLEQAEDEAGRANDGS
jgi:Putative prokaryotic signal transducing protein